MDTEVLHALYKAAFFLLQAKHFCEMGDYVNRRAKLADCLAGDDLAVLRQWLYQKPRGVKTEKFLAENKQGSLTEIWGDAGAISRRCPVGFGDVYKK